VHERHYSVREETDSLELLTWVARLTVAYGSEQSPTIHGASKAFAVPPPADARRSTAYFDGLGEVAVERVSSDTLRPGAHVTGPTFIDEPTTTIVVPPDWTVEVLPGGHYLMTRSAR
jgi:N-methylhydantoinase A